MGLVSGAASLMREASNVTSPDKGVHPRVDAQAFRFASSAELAKASAVYTSV